METTQIFETDIVKYTKNEKVINFFRKGYKIVWLSNSNTEKKEIVQRMEAHYGAEKRKMSESQNKSVDMVSKILNNANAKNKEYDNEITISTTYDDNQTVVQHALHNKSKDVILDPDDSEWIDSLFQLDTK